MTDSSRTPATPARSLAECYRLWDALADVPVSQGTSQHEADAIEAPFLHFATGTSREDIWHWFEAQNPAFVVGEVMSGLRQPIR